MNYFSHTGSVMTQTRPNPSTGVVADKKDGVVIVPNSKGNAVYIDKTQPNVSGGVRLVMEPSAKEELTKEEEAKFYRKVFKTSLL